MWLLWIELQRIHQDLVPLCETQMEQNVSGYNPDIIHNKLKDRQKMEKKLELAKSLIDVPVSSGPRHLGCAVLWMRPD